MADKLLTVGEAAERLGCTVKWVYKLLKQNRLRYQRFGVAYQIYGSSVRSFKPGPVGRPPVKKAHHVPRRAGQRAGNGRSMSKA